MHAAKVLLSAITLLFYLAPARGLEPVRFSRDIQPILETSCYRCHGAKRIKAGLRLDGPDFIRNGGASGHVVRSNHPEKSSLFLRINLSEDDFDLMPADGEKLPADQIELIRRWIEEGASMESRAPPPPEEFARFGIVILPVAAGSKLLSVSFRASTEGAKDRVADLESFANELVSLDLSRLSFDDEDASVLKRFINLRELNLSGTKITDRILPDLAALETLEILNLYGSQVSDLGLLSLMEASSLKRVCLADTLVTSIGIQKLRQRRPDLLIEDGTEKGVPLVPGEEPAPGPINAICPVSREPIDPDMYYVYQNQVIAFCRAECRARFVKEPIKWAKSVDGFIRLPDAPSEKITEAIKPISASPQKAVRHTVLAADASKGRVAIVGADGKIEWEAKTSNLHDLQILASGNILFQKSWTELVEMTQEKEIVWSYNSATQNGNSGKAVEVHSFRRLENDVTMIAESGPCRIIEVDRDGKLLRSIPLLVENPHPHRDTRLVRKLANHHYLVAHEGEGAVREYSPDGEMIWQYTVPLFGREPRGGHGPEAWGNKVFSAIRLPNGNTLISTGNGHSVLEVNRQKEIVWQVTQDELPGIRLGWVTTLEVLPGGNYLIGNCHAGPDQPQIIEITPEKRVVWTFRDFEHFGNSLSNSTLIDPQEDIHFYRTKVKPILSRNCYECHGDRDAKVQGELWLASRANVTQGGKSGAIFDPVFPERSRILRFINHEDEDHQMPPTRKLSGKDIGVLTDWVHRGAPMDVVEDEWTYERPGVLTDEARSLWSFQPVVDPTVPSFSSDWPENEIDAFLLEKLQAANLSPNAQAGKVSLLRRATYNLTGLPPTLEEIDRFLADQSGDSFLRVINRLLASPHYGEQWGRHWLDLVRYAQTNGYERDAPKPESWKYRQYVIDSLNEDKPYDRFVLEQLAGDELEDRTQESLTATGYYRLGLFDDEPSDREQALYDDLDDIVRTTGEVFLGLTVGCARCHDHKIDPIPQRDYYSMLSFFRNVTPYSTSHESILSDVSTLDEKSEVGRKNDMILESALSDLKDVRSERFVLSVKEPSPSPAETFVLIRGSAHVRGAQVEPAFLQVLGQELPQIRPTKSSSGRRLAFARWLADERNPLTARVIVNRVWQHHFGRGIVRSSSDFGKMGDSPTHPELLDWLARRLVEDGWSLKKLHRRIMTSAAYRMSSLPESKALQADPRNNLFWRFNMRRLSAEELWDSVRAVSGTLDLKVGGPSVYPDIPAEVLAGQSRNNWPGDGGRANNSRRSIYTFVKRSLIDPMVESFDGATTDTSCPVRFLTTQPTQALTLLNSEFINKAAVNFLARLRHEAGKDATDQIKLAFRLTTGRLPSEEEVSQGLEFLRTFPYSVTQDEAFRQYALMILNLNEFLFID